MAKNITLMGADYPDVPAVQLPQTEGGTATFYDIDVIDNLNSDSSTDALSAKQGKVLNSKFGGLKFELIRVQGTTLSNGTLEINNPTGTNIVYLISNTYSDGVSSSFGVINIESVTATKIMFRFRTLKDGSVNGEATIDTYVVIAHT